ncbi:MAG: CAP domain-containing protein [Pirellulaceae bacterium]
MERKESQGCRAAGVRLGRQGHEPGLRRTMDRRTLLGAGLAATVGGLPLLARGMETSAYGLLCQPAPPVTPIQPAPPLSRRTPTPPTDDPQYFAFEMHQLHNEARRNLGLPLLALHDQLTRVAGDYAHTLYRMGRLDHTLDGTVQTRLDRAGYRFLYCGENLAWEGPLSGIAGVRATFRGWQDSPRHGRKIANSNYREMGIAKRGVVWVVVFAAPA